MNKIKIIALIGEAGSGKDFLLHQVQAAHPEYHTIISVTTRPLRSNETPGQDYHFVDKDTFFEMCDNGDMLEFTSFNGWYYGTALQSIDVERVNIGVFNPAGVDHLLLNNNVDVQVFYVRAPERERLLRQLQRDENVNVKEVLRRFQTDLKDFSDLNFHYTNINNSSLSSVSESVARIVWAESSNQT